MLFKFESPKTNTFILQPAFYRFKSRPIQTSFSRPVPKCICPWTNVHSNFACFLKNHNIKAKFTQEGIFRIRHESGTFWYQIRFAFISRFVNPKWNRPAVIHGGLVPCPKILSPQSIVNSMYPNGCSRIKWCVLTSTNRNTLNVINVETLMNPEKFKSKSSCATFFYCNFSMVLPITR